MRGKRSKQYRKLMQQFALTFQFREPYQVLVDAQMIQDTHRFRMDLAPALTRTLHGEVKPMITQCSIRHLFALPTTTSSSEAGAIEPITQAEKTALLEISRSFTLRRCNHHTLPKPLSTLDCYRDVMDSTNQGTNKHRYILAAQEEDVRSWARGLKGVPMLYVKRSVMVMEPMAHASVGVREKEEKSKLRAGVRKSVGSGDVLGKRKREDVQDVRGKDAMEGSHEAEVKKKRKAHGLKGPNPLSMRRKKSKPVESEPSVDGMSRLRETKIPKLGNEASEKVELKKTRRRKHKGSTILDTDGNDSIEAASVVIETG